jgi:predicted nucleotide-binding protein (sugar kinase/HSP70/actin superfamily)
MGAIGVALLTKKYWQESGRYERGEVSNFIGLDAMERFSFTREAKNICPFCANSCSRTFVTFSNGTTWVIGNRCKRGEITGSADDDAVRRQVRKISAEMDAAPDMFKTRLQAVFREYPWTPVKRAGQAAAGLTIGLPRALDFWNSMPFWTSFFRALGFTVKLSRTSSRALFERGLPFIPSDTACFPAKLVHGHIRDLVEAKVDRIFMPVINRMPSETTEAFTTHVCPLVKGYPLIIRNSDDPEKRWNIPFDAPMFHWITLEDRNFQLCRYMNEQFGIPQGAVQEAIDQGDAALGMFKNHLRQEGGRIIAELEQNPSPEAFAVVLAGRHYQNDPLVNHELPGFFTNNGVPVLTLDSLPGINDVDLGGSRIELINNSHARLLAGAVLAARHPRLEFVQIMSFGCGHDAILSDEVIRLMNEISGKTPLILKLDESDVHGPLHIRVKSFIETVRMWRKKRAVAGETFRPRGLGEPYEIKFLSAHKRTKIILVPCSAHAELAGLKGDL